MRVFQAVGRVGLNALVSHGTLGCPRGLVKRGILSRALVVS